MEPAPVLANYTEVDKAVEKATFWRSSEPGRVATSSTVYCIPELAHRILENQYNSVALQFPDHLLADSTTVELMLKEELTKICGCISTTIPKIFILADTSYSPCCVDEIAARHLDAQVIVHFGNACLSPTKSLPVIYVFGEPDDVDMEKIEQLFVSEFPTTDQHILLLADPQYSKILDQLYSRIKSSYLHTIATKVAIPSETINATVIPEGIIILTDEETNTTQPHQQPQTILPNRTHPLLSTGLSNYHVLYITDSTPSPSLTLHLSTLVSSVTLLQMPDLILITPKTALQKRYRYMNIARTASTIGILINTLSHRNVNEMLKKVQHWITAAGKKHYTFVVGKPNVPKLANFDLLDIWVILGCPYGGIIVDNNNEFYKPIITPYELKLALQKDITWTGQWHIEFQEFLKNDMDTIEKSDSEKSGSEDSNNEDSDAPEFDPVTGTYVTTSRPLRQLQHINVEADPDEQQQNSSTSTSLIGRMSSQLVIRDTVSTAAQHLHDKLTWTGLGSDFAQTDDDANDHDDDAAELEPGREGIARGYKVITENTSRS